MDMIFSYLQDAMVALVAAAVCAVIAFLALWKFVSDLFGKDGKYDCVWNKDAFQPNEGQTRWLCATCGAFAFSADNKPPVTCRKLEPKPGV